MPMLALTCSRCSLHGERRAQCLQQVFGDSTGDGRFRDLRQHQDEFIARPAGPGYPLPDAGAQSLGDRLQQLVAGTVAQRVVDGLETVEVQEQDADVTLPAVSAVNGLTGAVDQQGYDYSPVSGS